MVGLETKGRKHVDWEIYSSMFDGRINKKSGILVINLPSTNCTHFYTNHAGEKERLYPEIQAKDWIIIENRSEFERRFPYIPDRIIDNLLKKDVKVSVVNWYKIENDFSALEFLIDATFNDRLNCNYDLNRQMRRADS